MCLLVTLNLYMHYFYAVTISPGFLDDPPRDPVNSFLWARKPKLEKGEGTKIREASQSKNGVTIIPASMAQCKKCNKMRPEVSLVLFLTSHAKLTVNSESSPLSEMQ
jgi:palmitoyltransferase